MQIERRYSIAGRDPLAGLSMRQVTLSDGRCSDVPGDWPNRAAHGLAAQVSDAAVDLRQVADRLVLRLRMRAEAQGRIDDPADATAWADEMRHMIARRIAVAAPGMWSARAPRTPSPAPSLPLAIDMGAALPQHAMRLAQAACDGAPLELRFGKATVAPRVVLDLGRFVIDGAVDVDALVGAVRVWTLALAVDAGQGDLGLAGLGGALMRLGLGPATHEGRAMGAAMAALAEAARLRAAADLGLGFDASAGARGLARLQDMAASFAAAKPVLSRTIALREGLVKSPDAPRAPRLVVAPLGDAAAILGSGPDPLAPARALTVETETPGGGHRRATAPELAAGLAAQGHGPDRIAALLRHVAGHGSLAAAPGIDHASLRACGLDAAQIARIEAALSEARDLRAVITPWRLGRAFCTDRFGLAPEDVAGHGMKLLERLGFAPERIDAANRHVFGHGTLKGAAGIDATQAEAFEAGPDLRAALAMAGAVSMVLEGPVTALLPLRRDAPARSVALMMRAARRAGLAALVIAPEAGDSPPLAARLREILAMLPPGIRPGTAPAEALEILDAAARSRPEARRHARALRERLLADPLPATRSPRRSSDLPGSDDSRSITTRD